MTTAEAEGAFPWLQDYWNTYGPVFGRPRGSIRNYSVTTLRLILKPTGSEHL
jgi:hypothetical protein